MSNKVKKILYIIFIFLITFLIVSSIYMRVFFPDNSIDELLFCLKFESPDSDFTPVFDALKVIIPYTILLFIFILSIIYLLKKLTLENKIIKKIIYSKKRTLLILVFILLFVFSYSFNLITFLGYKIVQSDFINDNYVSLDKNNISFVNKRNLIYIVLESFESSLLLDENGGSYKYSIMPEMDELVKEKDVITFKGEEGKIGAKVLEGASYTSSSLIANSTALPFKFNLFSKYDKNSFLNGIYNLGDLFYDNGYHNELISSATTNFGGLNYYYKKHGKYDIIDISGYKNYGLSLTESDKGPWGFNDNYMYETAKKRLEVLSKNNKPFNLTMVGIDTHFPDGFNGNYTLKRFNDSYSNAYTTESYLLYNFINWVRKQDFYENTTIVVIGDHLSMQRDFFKSIEKENRYVFTCYINAFNEPINVTNRVYTALDTYPTILGAIGVYIKDNKLGLGVNMFSKEKTLAEKYGYDYLNKELQKKSDFYFKVIQ